MEVGNILIFWIGLIKPQEKFGSGLQYSFHLNTNVMRYCGAKMNVISDVLRDSECRFSKTTYNLLCINLS